MRAESRYRLTLPQLFCVHGRTQATCSVRWTGVRQPPPPMIGSYRRDTHDRTQHPGPEVHNSIRSRGSRPSLSDRSHASSRLYLPRHISSMNESESAPPRVKVDEMRRRGVLHPDPWRHRVSGANCRPLDSYMYGSVSTCRSCHTAWVGRGEPYPVRDREVDQT